MTRITSGAGPVTFESAEDKAKFLELANYWRTDGQTGVDNLIRALRSADAFEIPNVITKAEAEVFFRRAQAYFEAHVGPRGHRQPVNYSGLATDIEKHGPVYMRVAKIRAGAKDAEIQFSSKKDLQTFLEKVESWHTDQVDGIINLIEAAKAANVKGDGVLRRDEAKLLFDQISAVWLRKPRAPRGVHEMETYASLPETVRSLASVR